MFPESVHSVQEKVTENSTQESSKPSEADTDTSEAPPPQTEAKQRDEQQEQEPQEPELTVASGRNDGGYESSDEDVARVHALHSSALEFIKSLRETDEESIGESVSDTTDMPPVLSLIHISEPTRPY